MNEWIPLFGPTVTVLGALAVALWNSRGESRDVRQLKAMNDVIAGLPAEAEATKAFVDARDGMLVHVAAGVAALPRRRGITWTVVGIVFGAGTAVFLAWLLAPIISTAAFEWLSAGATVLAALAAAITLFVSLRAQKRSEARAQKEIDVLLASFNAARRRRSANEDPGKSRSA